MNEITLKQFLTDHTQSQAAAILGMTQSAVSQALAAGRDIRILLDEENSVVEAFEKKSIHKS